MRQKMQYGPDMETAERIAIAALGFIAADSGRLNQFLRATGHDPARIREAAGSPEFLAGVLEFLLSDESQLLVFVSHQGIAPADVAAARRRLADDWGDGA